MRLSSRTYYINMTSDKKCLIKFISMTELQKELGKALSIICFDNFLATYRKFFMRTFFKYSQPKMKKNASLEQLGENCLVVGQKYLGKSTYYLLPATLYCGASLRQHTWISWMNLFLRISNSRIIVDVRTVMTRVIFLTQKLRQMKHSMTNWSSASAQLG